MKIPVIHHVDSGNEVINDVRVVSKRGTTEHAYDQTGSTATSTWLYLQVDGVLGH